MSLSRFLSLTLSCAVFLFFFQVPSVLSQDEGQQETQAQKLKVIRIDVRGNRAINTNTILNNMKTRPGLELDQQMVNEDIKRLYGTGYFQDIRIDVEETAEGVRLIVVVDEKPIVRRILIEGNELIKERDIRKDLGVLEGQTLDEFAIKQGINKITDQYANKGFRFAKVKYRVDTDRVTKEATIVITIEEGAKFRIGRVQFEGNHEFEYDEAKGKIIIKIQIEEGKRYETAQVDIKGVQVVPESEVWQRLKMLPGTVFSQQGLAEEVQGIRNFYFRFGHMNVQILPDVKVNRETGKVDVAYQIEEGDLYFVDKVKVRGNTKTKDIVIRGELRIYPGEKFDGDALDKSKQRLENLGFFEEVSYDTEEGSAPNRRDIVFKVKEKRTGELSFGAGISSIDQFIGFAEIAQRNFDLLNWPRFTGGGQNISLRGRWGTITRDFAFSFEEPYLFNKPISFGFDVYDVRNENRNVDFREERMGLGTTFSKAFTDFIRAGFVKIKRKITRNRS